MPKDVDDFLVGDDDDLEEHSGSEEESAVTESSRVTDVDMDDVEETEEDILTNILEVDKAVAELISFTPPTVDRASELPLPKGLSPSLTLHDYQVCGFNWLERLARNRLGGILGDEMGLGKTVQLIALMSHMAAGSPTRKHASHPFLVLCPLSVVDTWSGEMKKFAPSLVPIVYIGDPLSRERLRETMQRSFFHVIITTYEVLMKDEVYLSSSYTYEAIIVDEGHRLKNTKSQLYNLLCVNFKSHSKFILTGTPVQNNINELFALLHFVYPKAWPEKLLHSLVSSFCNLSTQSSQQYQRIKKEKIPHLRKLLAPFLLRRTKADVKLSLPPMSEVVVFTRMTELQRHIYKSLLIKDRNVFRGDFSVSLQNIVVKLQQCCNHPYLFPNVEPEPFTEGDHIWRSSGKLFLLEKMLPRLKAEGHRVLLFSQFTSMLDIVQDFLTYRGFMYERIDGSVRGADRWDSVSKFHRDNSVFIFLISTRAGGVGLNLAAADVVILLDSDWNPQVDLQAVARAHRQGQTKPVRVYRFVTKDSVEEVILRRGLTKLALTADVIGDPDEAYLPSGEDERGEGDFRRGRMREVVEFGLASLFDSKTASDDWHSSLDADKIFNSVQDIGTILLTSKGDTERRDETGKASTDYTPTTIVSATAVPVPDSLQPPSTTPLIPQAPTVDGATSTRKSPVAVVHNSNSNNAAAALANLRTRQSLQIVGDDSGEENTDDNRDRKRGREELESGSKSAVAVHAADSAATTSATGGGTLMTSTQLIDKSNSNIYQFDGAQYSSTKTRAEKDAEILERILNESDPFGGVLHKGTSRVSSVNVDNTDGDSNMPAKKKRVVKVRTEEEKDEVRRRKAEAAREAAEAEEERKLEKWARNNYVSRSLKDPSDFESLPLNVHSDSPTYQLKYTHGDASNPPLDSETRAAIILHLVDDSGSWDSRGFFHALNRLSLLPSKYYSEADMNGDLFLGDAHLVFLGKSQSRVNYYVCLLVAQRARDNKIMLDHLATSLGRLHHVVTRITSASVHLPRLGHGSSNFEWYTIERLLKKNLSNVPTTVYYFDRYSPSKGGGQQDRERVTFLSPSDLKEVYPLDHLRDWMLRCATIPNIEASFPAWKDQMASVYDQTMSQVRMAIDGITDHVSAGGVDDDTKAGLLFMVDFMKSVVSMKEGG